MSIHDNAEAARRKVYDDVFSEQESKIAELTGQTVLLSNQVSALSTELESTKTALAVAVSELKDAQADANDAEKGLEEAEASVAALTAQIAVLQARIRELEETAPETPQEATAGLPFFADAAVLAASDKKWLDHYFPVFPISIENGAPATDYYARNWLTRDGEGGIHAATGGRLRDRPITAAPYPGDWRRAAAAQEIRDAKRYLRDGFFVNLMSTTASHANNYNALRDEANANFPGFLVVPMVDVNGSIAGYNGSLSLADQSKVLASTSLVSTVGSFLKTQNTWTLPDGSVVVGSYKANGRTQAWWADLAAKLKTATGKTVTFVHVYNNSPSSADISSRPAYASGAWSMGADPAVLRASGSSTNYKAAGRLLMGVQPQNIRPGTGYGPWFDEACNTEALRVNIAKAISDGASVVQGVTWSDLTEGGQFMPSVMRGTAALEISALGIYEWKTGKKPEILKDYMVISHRNQMLNATINPPQQTLMVQNTSRASRSAVRNKIEILTYLTAPDRVTVDVAGTKVAYDAPAGEFAYLIEAKPGKVSASTTRGLSLASPIEIRSVTGNQDRQYAMVSTLGPTTKQYDPTPKG